MGKLPGPLWMAREKIITDQGKSFENQLVKELCDLTEVQKLHTTPYRPQTNGSW